MVSELTIWDLGDTSGSWSAEKSGLRAIPMSPGKPINETPAALLADFNVGDRRYQIYVVYDPRAGVGQIRLNVDPVGSVE